MAQLDQSTGVQPTTSNDPIKQIFNRIINQGISKGALMENRIDLDVLLYGEGLKALKGHGSWGFLSHACKKEELEQRAKILLNKIRDIYCGDTMCTTYNNVLFVNRPFIFTDYIAYMKDLKEYGENKQETFDEIWLFDKEPDDEELSDEERLSEVLIPEAIINRFIKKSMLLRSPCNIDNPCCSGRWEDVVRELCGEPYV